MFKIGLITMRRGWLLRPIYFRYKTEFGRVPLYNLEVWILLRIVFALAVNYKLTIGHERECESGRKFLKF